MIRGFVFRLKGFGKTVMPILIALFLTCESQAKALQEKTWDFLETHCMDCHDDDVQKGGLNLDAFPRKQISGEFLVERWTRIYDRVKAGEMPPPEKKVLEQNVISDFLDGLNPVLETADKELREVVHRRLNREEYETIIQDLLGIEIELKHLLPEDQEAGGFDNNGAALAMSPDQIEKYLEAAKLALEEAIVEGERPESKVVTASAIPETKRYWGKGFGYHDGHVFGYLTSKTSYSKIATRRERVKVRGKYRFKFTAMTRNTDKPVVFSLVRSGHNANTESTHIGYYEAEETPKLFEIEYMMDPGDCIQFFPQGLPKWGKDPDVNGFAGVGFSDVEITGPLHPQWPPASHTNLVGDIDMDSGTLEDASKVLGRLAESAFRRPLVDGELDRYTQLVANELEDGRSFREALVLGMQAILCSTNFLYLREDVHDEGKLSNYELASRLSYFFWSSLPDSQLLELAAKGRLMDDGVLAQQVDRMLKDAKADRFVRNFTGQWLKLRDINDTTPDSKLYASFDELLQSAMVAEGEAFFKKILQDDLPISNFLHSDFIMANQRLANHYGIDGVEGIQMRPVQLEKDSVRGGVLTQAGVLKVTANGTNTSPVMRGVWVLEHILGEHVPPPPPNVSGIEPDIREATTIREKLDLHRDSESCRSCHLHIDPPGFALESFDPTGAYRERYLQFKVNPEHADKGWGRVVQAKEVDASGEMARGEKFSDIREFKQLLLADQSKFAKCLTEHLLSYGLGRELGFSDRKEVEEIVKLTKAKGNGLRTLIQTIVASNLYHRR